MEQVQSRLFYSPDEFRRILRCSRHVCYEALHQKKIRSFKFGRKIFIPASEIERLSQSAVVENDPGPEIDPELW